MIDLKQLSAMLRQEPYSAVERTLATLFRRDWEERNPFVLWAAAQCALAVREGHTYLDLSKPPESLPDYLQAAWPSLDHWSKHLTGSSLVGKQGEAKTPLVWPEQSALYLEKYYAYERRLASLIVKRAGTAPSSELTDPVERAARSDFFVITGGPGTGKTTLALRYLREILEGWTLERRPRFVAVAPTGKAAARLRESIATGLPGLQLDKPTAAFLGEAPCLTIHRLLGTLPFRPRFRHDQRNPAPYDVVIIDESSMIDLPLMTRLFEGLPEGCRILMLGDRDQLSSVEVGTVFSDILQASETKGSRLQPRVHRLTKTYRFSEDSAIYRACQATRQGDGAAFEALLATSTDDWSFHALHANQSKAPAEALRHGLARWQSLSSSKSPAEALENLTRQTILTPTRRGPFGSNEINRQLQLGIGSRLTPRPTADESLHAAPIIVTENDYEAELFNGDLGVLWRDERGTAAYFPSVSGEPRRYRLSELPKHESAFALTIHKSQGSEFDEVVCLFGPGASKSVSRELIYTAFSRAKLRLSVFGVADELRRGVQRSVERATRLAPLLAQLEAQR